MNGWGLFAKLLEVAGDHEADVVEDLMIRAGLCWRCADDGFVNDNDDTCQCCDASKPVD